MNLLHDSIAHLLSELVEGPPKGPAYMLNPGDPGLLRSLESLTAAAASQAPPNGAAPIAAHVDHVCYGIDLLNRWYAGEPDPWSDADWTASWRRRQVSDEEWAALRNRLRNSVAQWRAALQQPRDLSATELDTVIGAVAHLAYHFGSIRQIDRALRGPAASRS